ncbi:S8 family serine peptidase [Spirulina sp. CS-785/01]|uniref:S8 family serine peptidase n=1 Tax=Spirulina sp. CS-785/01 TaxID=3021716 RepID=UPI00232E552D|nr:S8 family serine peptidase [Spirulina sp. CS-785/01]MDB9312889.1 S8 family serine peptidase [Spirulina sp. CS-785/01]
MATFTANNVNELINVINQANDTPEADTINLIPTTFNLTSSVAGDIEYEGLTGLPHITSEITINGNGATIQRDPSLPDDDSNSFRIFLVSGPGNGPEENGNLTLNDLTIKNGRAVGNSNWAVAGGGLFNFGGAVALDNVKVTENMSISGGGISNQTPFLGEDQEPVQASMTIRDSEITNNIAGYPQIASGWGGGIENNNSSVTIEGKTVISGNSALTFEDSEGSYSWGLGGGIYNGYEGDITINAANPDDIQIINNKATVEGSAIYITDDKAVLTVNAETQSSVKIKENSYTSPEVFPVSAISLIDGATLNLNGEEKGAILITNNGSNSVASNGSGISIGAFWEDYEPDPVYLNIKNTIIKGNKGGYDTSEVYSSFYVKSTDNLKSEELILVNNGGNEIGSNNIPELEVHPKEQYFTGDFGPSKRIGYYSQPTPFSTLKSLQSFTAPTLADVDGDGDLDAFVGSSWGTLAYYQNKEDNTFEFPTALNNDNSIFPGLVPLKTATPDFIKGIILESGLKAEDVFGQVTKPSIVDIDGDGDLDIFIGEHLGFTYYFENNGDNTFKDPVSADTIGLEQPTVNSGNLVTPFYYASPTFVNVDGDSVIEYAFVGGLLDNENVTDIDSVLKVYKNQSSNPANPQFSVLETNSLFENSVEIPENQGLRIVPEVVDFDSDGDFDLFLAQTMLDDETGEIRYFENIRTNENPQFIEITLLNDHPFAYQYLDTPANSDPWIGDLNQAVPEIVDFDNDGLFEVFVGTRNPQSTAQYIPRLNSILYLVQQGDWTPPQSPEIPSQNSAFNLIGLTQLRQLRNDPQISWTIDGTPNPYNLLTGSQRFSVAVIDTVVDPEHPLLSPNYITGETFAGNGNIPATVNNNTDFQHGTHVAGTIGANDSSIGVAPGVGLIGLNIAYRKKETDDEGNITYGSKLSSLGITNALKWLSQNQEQYNTVAVNMSLGGGPYLEKNLQTLETTSRYELVKTLEKLGVTVIATAGNDYGEFAREDNPDINAENKGVNAPAIYSSLLIGAVWGDGRYESTTWPSYFNAKDNTTGADKVVSFSQRLDVPNMLFAPGTSIRSTIPEKEGNLTIGASGTSMAAPHVSGAVALMQEASLELGGRKLAPETVVDYFTTHADRIFDGTPDEATLQKYPNLVNDPVENTNVLETNKTYKRLNIYKSVTALQDKFNELKGTTQDIDGTQKGADLFTPVYAPLFFDNEQGEPTQYSFPFLGSIGIDGVSNQVGPKDVDLYRIIVEDSITQLNVNLLPHPTYPTNDFNATLRLFDSTGTPLNSEELPVNGSSVFTYSNNSLLDINPDNPTNYYIGISGAGNTTYDVNEAGSGTDGTQGNYKLSFNFEIPDPDGTKDTASNAELTTDGTTNSIQGNIGQDQGTDINALSDVDMYKVVIPDNGVVFIDIDTPNNNFVQSFLRVFDEAGNPVVLNGGAVAENDNGAAVATTPTGNEFNSEETPSNNTDSFLYFQAAKGRTYYIGISEEGKQAYDSEYLAQRPDPGTGGDYSLNLTLFKNNPNSNPLNAPSDISDPDGSISLAQGLEAISLPMTNQRGEIGTDTDPFDQETLEVGENDVDFYKVNSPTSGLLKVDASAFNASESDDPLQAVLLLLTENGTPIASTGSSGLDADQPVVIDRNPRIIYEVEADTDYYVAVTGSGSEDFDPEIMGSGSPGDTGEYVLNSEVLDLEELERFSDDKISNPAVQTISLEETIFGEIGSDEDLVVGADDVDLYRFVATFTGKLRIRTTTNSARSADTFLRLFDADGQELAANDDENEETRGSFLEVDVVQGETYFVGVNGASENAGNYNPVAGTGKVPGSVGDYQLSLTGEATDKPTPPEPTPQKSQVLNATSNNIFVLGGTPGQAIPLQLSITQVNSMNAVHEIGVIKVDDDQGAVDGLLPGESQYFQAAASRTTTIASGLPDTVFERFSSSRTVNFQAGDRLLFYMVQNSTSDTVLNALKQGQTPPQVFFANNGNALQVTSSGTEQFTLKWEDGMGGSPDFNDLALSLSFSPNGNSPLGTGLQGQPEGELIDLRGLGVKTATLDIRSEARYSNTVGFYRIDDETGEINGLMPGDENYAQVALEERRVMDFQTGETPPIDFEGLLAPFIIANATVAEFLEENVRNLSGGEAMAYFPFMAANPDGVDHLRLLGDNVFGFEDLPGGGDRDYNDMVFQVEFG